MKNDKREINKIWPPKWLEFIKKAQKPDTPFFKGCDGVITLVAKRSENLFNWAHSVIDELQLNTRTIRMKRRRNRIYLLCNLRGYKLGIRITRHKSPKKEVDTSRKYRKWDEQTW